MSPHEATHSIQESKGPVVDTGAAPPVGETTDQSDRKPGIVSQVAHNALSKENFLGMGAGFVARELLKKAVGGPIIAPVIGTVSAVASGIAREAHRAEQIDNFSDYLRYQRGEVTYDKLSREQKARVKEQEEKMGIQRATPLPKRVFGFARSVLESTGKRIEDATGIGHAIGEKINEAKTRVVQTSGYTDISHRLETIGKKVVQTVTEVVQSKEAQSVIDTLRRVDVKVKDIATGQSKRLDRLDRIGGEENEESPIAIDRTKIHAISVAIRERKSKGDLISRDEVKNMLGFAMTDEEMKKTISQLEKVATDAFIAYAVAAKGQKHGEKDVRTDTISLAKDTMRVVRALKGEGIGGLSVDSSQDADVSQQKRYDSLRKHISKEAKAVVARSVVAAGLKRAALAPITSFIGSEVSAALRPTINTIVQPILRPIQESIAQEVRQAVTGVTGLISGAHSPSLPAISETIPIPSHIVVPPPSLIESHAPHLPSVSPVAEPQPAVNIPRPTATEHMGSSKLASPVKFSHPSTEVAAPEKTTVQLRVNQGASLSETVQNAGLMSKDFNQPGSAKEFYDRVIAPNASKFTVGEFDQLTKALEKADTMGEYYQNNKQLFQNSWMEKLTTQDDVNIALKTSNLKLVADDSAPLPQEIIVPKGSSLLAELNNTGAFTEKELSTPGSAKDFYLRFIAQNPQLKAGEKLRFMESSTESFYKVASKKPEVYKLLSSIKADAKFRVGIPTQANDGLPVQSTDAKLTDAKPITPQLVEPSPLQSELISKDQSGVKWHFVTDGTAGVMRVKLNGGDVRDVVFVPNDIAGISPDVAKSTRFELMGSIQTLLSYDEKDVDYLLRDLDKEMTSLYASAHPDAKPLSNLLLKALLTDAFQKDKLLPTVSHDKGYIKDLFSRILKTKDIGLLEKINAYSLDQAMTRSSSSASKLLMPKYEQSLRSLLDGVKSQSDLMEKLVKNPAVVGMKMGKIQASENKSANEYFNDLLGMKYGPNDDVLTRVPENIVPSKSTILDSLPTFTESAPIVPRSVTIESGDTLLAALQKTHVFSDTELKSLKLNGGGKLFFDRIIQPNVGSRLIFTDAEGAALQKILNNQNANFYSLLYDPKLSKDFTKLTRLLPGQTWVVKPSLEQQQALDTYTQKLEAYEKSFIQDNESQAREDTMTLAIKLRDIPFTPAVFVSYLTHGDETTMDIVQVQSVLKELSKEGLIPTDIEIVRELAKEKGIDDFGIQLAGLMSSSKDTEHPVANALKQFIAANDLANDMVNNTATGIPLLNRVGYDNVFINRQILSLAGFNPEAFPQGPGITKFGENVFVVRGVNGDMKQEFISRLGDTFAQQASSFEYRAVHVIQKIISFPSQTFESLQKDRLYIPFICEAISSDNKQTLLAKLIADAKFFGVFEEADVVKLYNTAMTGDLAAYYELEKILSKPGEAASYLRSLKPSEDGNVLYQILRPDKNPDVGHVLGKVKDYGRYLGLEEYRATTPPNNNLLSSAKMDRIKSGGDIINLPRKPASELPTQLDKSVSIDSLFHSRYDDNIFVQAKDGTLSRLTGTLQESVPFLQRYEKFPVSFLDFLTKIENTQQTGDEFLNRILGRNIATGALLKIDEILSWFKTNVAGDRVLGGGSSVDMQLSETLLGDPYSSEATSLFGRRPDLYGRVDYFAYLVGKIHNNESMIVPDDTSPFKPDLSFQPKDIRAAANADTMSKIISKMETYLITKELEARYSHDALIEAYINHVPMGAAGNLAGGQGRPIIGFQAASKIYFGKPMNQLSSAEQIVLIKIANSPGGRSPVDIAQVDGTLHPALSSSVRDIESRFIPAAKTPNEKEFLLAQIEAIKKIHFVNIVPDEWKLESQKRLPLGTYAMLNDFINGRLTHQDVAYVPGAGYIMELQQPTTPRTFGGVEIPKDYVPVGTQTQYNSLIENRFAPRAGGGYEVVTDKGQRITIPSFTQAYQDENGKWITVKKIGVGVVAVDVDTMEPIIDYDPSKTILGYAPPASTIKPFVASFLQSKGVDINTALQSNLPGQYALDGSNLRVVNHSEYLDHVNQMTLAQALLDSSNVPFQYAMKEYLAHNPNGWAEFQDFMKHFGIPLRNYDGKILEKPSAFGAIGTDVVVNMEDYARAYALLARPEKIFNDPHIIRSIQTITDHMTSQKSLQYIAQGNQYPIQAQVMNGQPVTYFTKSGTEGTNSLLNAGFVKSADGKIVSIVTRVVNQGILFNAKGEPYATTGNLVNILGSGQAWGSRTASPISFLTAESIYKNYLQPAAVTNTSTPVAIQDLITSTQGIPNLPATPGVGSIQVSSSLDLPPKISIPIIMYGGRDSDWSIANPMGTSTTPIFTSQAIDWNKKVNVAATEIVTSLSKLRPDEKPILLGHSFGANAVMTAAYIEIKNKMGSAIRGLILEDPDFSVSPGLGDSIAGMGTISHETPVLLILSKGRTISATFLQDHPNITVSYYDNLQHGELPADSDVQKKIAEWTAQLQK
ncbi:MAG: transglycosylase domain-containing protein [Candidatus Roizmanbacteria bacterium]